MTMPFPARLLSLPGAALAFATGAVAVVLLGTSVTEAIMAPLCRVLAALGEAECQLIFAAPSDAFGLRLRQGVLGGLILAIPALVFVLARYVAPSLHREQPRSAMSYAWAGGILALAGAAFALFQEAPRAFAPALMHLKEMAGSADMLGLETNYVRAALAMAFGYVLTLQVPVIVIMMIRSARLRRAIEAEGTA